MRDMREKREREKAVKDQFKQAMVWVRGRGRVWGRVWGRGRGG